MGTNSKLGLRFCANRVLSIVEVAADSSMQDAQGIQVGATG